MPKNAHGIYQEVTYLLSAICGSLTTYYLPDAFSEGY